MLHLGTDVLFVIWSTTIGKIVSGHSLDSRFFFLVIFPFVASPFILSFFWKVCICSAKGDTPLDPRFFFLLLSFLFFSFLCFSFSSLCFKFFSSEISILFCFFDRAYWASRAVHVHNRNYRLGIRWMQLSNYWAKNGFFLRSIQVVHICPKHVLVKRGEYASAYGTELRLPPVFRSTNASLRSAIRFQPLH